MGACVCITPCCLPCCLPHPRLQDGTLLQLFLPQPATARLAPNIGAPVSFLSFRSLCFVSVVSCPSFRARCFVPFVSCPMFLKKRKCSKDCMIHIPVHWEATALLERGLTSIDWKVAHLQVFPLKCGTCCTCLMRWCCRRSTSAGAEDKPAPRPQP